MYLHVCQCLNPLSTFVGARPHLDPFFNCHLAFMSTVRRHQGQWDCLKLDHVMSCHVMSCLACLVRILEGGGGVGGIQLVVNECQNSTGF